MARIELEDEKAASILGEAIDGRALGRDELTYLASRKGADVNFALFQAARRICERSFGRRVFIYGFVYFSTYCRNSCSFCYYRMSNTLPPRYRMGLEEVMEAVGELDKYGIHLVDLTMGEDPQICGDGNYEPLLGLCRAIKAEHDLPVMVSPGVAPRSKLGDLRAAGADWYALYQETHNRALFAKLRVGQDYDARAGARRAASDQGLLVEDGILLGVGESGCDVVDSISEMRSEGVQQGRAMGFNPQPGTPLSRLSPPPILDEMRAIALMRISLQDRLIPASYDVDGVKGLELRIMAGANVVTSMIPPEAGLHGVAQADLGIDSSQRTVDGIAPYLRRLGLEVGSRGEYRRWVDREMDRLCRG